MTDKFSESDRLQLVEYRIERAENTLKEADYNAEGGYYIAAVSRLYYAVYYAASALMAYSDIDVATHAGIKTMLSLHFIRTGKLSTEIGKIYGQLFDSRHSNDYDDFVYCDKAMYDEMRPKASILIEAVKDLIFI